MDPGEACVSRSSLKRLLVLPAGISDYLEVIQ